MLIFSTHVDRIICCNSGVKSTKESSLKATYYFKDLYILFMLGDCEVHSYAIILSLSSIMSFMALWITQISS
jgi:hypothetical protein